MSLDPKSTSVLLPMIRKVLPNLIAQDILGVQPMSAPRQNEPMTYGNDLNTLGQEVYWVKPAYVSPSSIFTLRVNYSSVTPSPKKAPDPDDMLDWCAEFLVRDDWYISDGVFFFLKESDRTAFVLRWE